MSSSKNLPQNKVKQILGKHILADGYDVIMDYEKSHGSWIIDRFSGEEYLDMFAMFASSTVGYNHPHLAKHEAWLGKHATYRPTMSDIYFQEYADFMKVMDRVAIPEELQYCFFIDGGALAVENALKAAFDWKTRKNQEKGVAVESSQVIHFQQAFHGRSGYTMSLTNTADPRKYKYFPKFNWPRIVNPKLHFPLTEESLEETKTLERQAEVEIEKALSENPDDIACIIIEPIQCEGGDNHFRPEFLQKLRHICDEHEILLVFDEVQVGMGITGSMFAWQQLGVTPDVMAFGKKTQVCGILANKDKFDEVENHVFQESSRINSTFGGNFIDMLRLKLILEVMEKEDLLNHVRQQGKYLLEGLRKLEDKHPLITHTRGRGLLCAFDLTSGVIRDQVVENLLKDEKMIILPCGEKTIRFRPQLTVSANELKEALARIDRVISRV